MKLVWCFLARIFHIKDTCERKARCVRSTNGLKSYLDQDQKTGKKNKGQVEPQQLQQGQCKAAFLSAFLHRCRDGQGKNIPHTNTQSLGNIWASHWHQEQSLCFLTQPEQLTQGSQASFLKLNTELWGRETTHSFSFCLCIWYWTHFLVSRAELHNQVENLLNHEQNAQWQNCKSQLFWAKMGTERKRSLESSKAQGKRYIFVPPETWAG